MAAVENDENNARDSVVKEQRAKKMEEGSQEDQVSKLDPGLVLKAVEALLKVVDETQKAKSNLIEEDTPIQLQYNFRKIPQLKNKRFHARIPHTLVTDNTDVCLFVKDVHKGAEDQEDKRDFAPSVRHFRKIVEDAGVKKVEEIIPVIQLKREYHDFEMQRKLCDSFDLFLCDERISKFMPKLLGKNFYKKRKLPINVKLHLGTKTATTSLKKAFESAHGLISGQGSTTSVTIGHAGMTSQQVAENIVAVVKRMAFVLPGGWSNISGLYLTTTKTTSIPLFVSTASTNDVKLPPDVVAKKRLIASGDPGLIGDEEDEEGHGIVQVFDDGSIRIMGEEDEKESEGDVGGGKKRKKRKKQEKPASETANGEAPSDPPGKSNKTEKKETYVNDKNPKTQKKSPTKKKRAIGEAPNAKKVKVASTKGPLSKKPRLK